MDNKRAIFGVNSNDIISIKYNGSLLSTVSIQTSCDLNTDGNVYDIGDINQMAKCNNLEIGGSDSYDLNNDGTNCDIGDIVKIVRCNNKDITCPK